MSTTQPTIAVCPKCKRDLIYVTAAPHPKGPHMLQTIFVCYPCNRTWNYALSPEMAAPYATEADRGGHSLTNQAAASVGKSNRSVEIGGTMMFVRI